MSFNSDSLFPLLNTNDTLHQWSRAHRKCNPKANDILVTMPLEGQNLAVEYGALHYNQMFKSHNITSSIDGFHFNHQLVAGRYMIFNDILLLMHEPGTGKTRTQLNAMLIALTAGLIKKILIINRSTVANDVAIQTLKLLYNYEFIRHYELPFGKFQEQYVSTRTIKKLNDHDIEDYTGIIIDEAHVMNTEEERSDTKKSRDLTDFIHVLSGKRGIKMILSTATPIFGKTSVERDYMRLFFRTERPMQDYGINQFNASMVSYTMINYDHIKIKQVMNETDTLVNEKREEILSENRDSEVDRAHGDKSFRLDDGYGEHKLYLYLTKPSPMQIADLARISIIADGDRPKVFCSDVKPIIVCSSRPTPGPDGFRYQSPILDGIVERGMKSTYGVIVIYCDIKVDGANKAAEYFRERYGIKAYNANEQRSTKAKSTVLPLNVRGVDQVITKYRELARLAYEKIPKITKSEQAKMEKVFEEYEKQYESYSTPNSTYFHISDLPFNPDVIAKMRDKLNAFKEFSVQENDIMAEINRYNTEIDRLLAIRAGMMEKYVAEQEKENKQHRYFIYEPSMTSNDKVIFEKINSPENWDGSIVKYVIGSRVMRDGTDIKHGIEIDILIPEWRIPGLVQAQHRIIRSNGHNEIIRQLAIKLVEEHANDKNPLTRSEAQAIIRKKGIDVSIYNHLLDVESITPKDVEEAIPYFTKELNWMIRTKHRTYTPEVLKNIRNAICSEKTSRGGLKLYESAIACHKAVGTKQIKMRSSAIDYILNVRKDLRARLRNQLEPSALQSDPIESTQHTALGATEMFFADYHIKKITESIKSYLLMENAMNTDEIVEKLLQEDPMYSVQVIAMAIKLLVERDKYIYNDNMGINMIIHLYKTETESILYLSTNEDPNGPDRVNSSFETKSTPRMNHPFNKRVNALRVSLIEEFRREPTIIDQGDLTLPKKAETFYKLYDLIERATRPDHFLTEYEYEFLVQMSEYWMVLEEDIVKNKSIQEMTFYVIEKHIDRPSIDILSKNLLVHEFDARPNIRKWKIKYTLSIRDQRFVRLGQLAQNYAGYTPNGTEENARSNGLILTKSVYTPPSRESRPFDEKDSYKNTQTYRFFEQEDSLMQPYDTSVIMKESGVAHMKGYQISQSYSTTKYTRENIIKLICTRAMSNMYLVFFLYRSTTSNEQRFRNYVHTLRTIKEQEYKIIADAKIGHPIPMFQIEMIEKLDGKEKEQEYIKIYSDR